MSEAFDPYRKWLGIPPSQQPPHHYRLLGIELFEADADAIANAADRQMAHIRTFQAGPHSALSQKLLNELSAARICLLNSQQKEAYDDSLRAQLAASQAAVTPNPAVAPNPAAAPNPTTAGALPPASAPPLAPAAPRAIPILIAAPVRQHVSADPSLDFASARQIEQSRGDRRPAWMAPAVAAIALVGLGGAAYLGAHFFGGAGEQVKQASEISQPTPDEPLARQPSTANESPTQPALAPNAAAANRASEASALRDPDAAASHAHATPMAQPANRSADAASAPPPASATPQPSPLPSNTGPSAMPPNGNVFRVPPPEPVALLAGQIDVLKEIDLQRDVVAGEWRLEGEELISPPGGLARLRIAVPPGEEYVLVVDVERLSGAGGFGVGLSARDAHAVMWFDGQGAEDTGLDGFPSKRNRIGRRLQLEGTFRLAYGVRKTGAVLLQPGSGAGISWSGLVQWQGDFAAWKWPAGWVPPEKGRLELISSEASFRVRRLVLARAEGWEVDDSNVVRAAKGVPAFVPNRPNARAFGQSQVQPESKAAVPDPADLAAARQQAISRHLPRYSSATTPEARLNLARFVIGEAQQSRPAPERYALFDYARTLAAELGGAAVAFEAVTQMARRFEIDELALKLESLEAAAKAPATPQGKVEQLAAGLELMEACANADRIAEANRAHAIAHAAARAVKDAGLTKQVNERKREIDRIAKALVAVKSDYELLETAPDDPAANLAVGKYLCLTRQKWDDGLKHLAAGSDETLADLARRELNAPAVPEDQFKLAEDWWTRAAEEAGPSKASLEDRARHWYRKAAPFLTGEAKQTAQRRMGAAGEVADESKTRYLSEMPEIGSKSVGFLKGRAGNAPIITVKGVESPHGLFVKPRGKGVAEVGYDLDRKARRFKAETGIDDSALGNPSSPLLFEIWGDGKLMWKSGAVIAKGQLQGCDLNVARIKLLQLRVVCPGANGNADCVWIEPRVTLK